MFSAHEIMHLTLAAVAIVLICFYLREIARAALRLFTLAFGIFCSSIVCATLERFFIPAVWNMVEHFCYAQNVTFTSNCSTFSGNSGS